MWRGRNLRFSSRAALAVLIALSAIPLSVYPQEATVDTDTPTIGLVLSGGGARGGAHIGVLRALEELRVPVHLIAGTSIGAAIGGFYASGMSVEELEEFIGELDFDAAFFNSTPRQMRSFRRKRDDDLFLVGQRPGLNDGEFDLPTGIVQGQVIDTIMSRATLSLSGFTNFDDLKIPFRAVAGDIATGESVVLSSGTLSTAIRASMAIPAVLTPVELDGRLLVDGGIVMNLPVEVAQSMGADIVIAIDVSSEMYTRDEISSLVDITAQLTTLLTRNGVVPQRALLSEEDVLVVPRFERDFSSASFDRIRDTIDIGYDAVMSQREALERYALSAPDYAAYSQSLVDPRQTDLPTIEFINISNDSIIADGVVRDRLRNIRLGEPLDVETLENSIERVYGLEFYQTVNYSIVEEAGRTGLGIDLNSRSWGPNYLQLGVLYNSSGDANSVFGLAASYLRTAINERGGEWRATFSVGDEPGFLASMHQPLGSKGRFFVAPSLDINSQLFSNFSDDVLTSEFNVRQATVEIAAGRELAEWGEIRGGLRRGDGEARVRVGDPLLFPNRDYQRGEIFARFSADTLDSIAFPRAGILASIEWRGSQRDVLAADADYDQVLVSAAHANSWGRHTLLTTLRYDSTVSGVAPIERRYRFGGFFDLSGLNSDQLSGEHVARVGASYYRRIGDLALFPAFAGISVELGNAWESRSEISFNKSLVGGALWAGVDTPVGPVYVAYGLAEGGKNAFYVFLGKVF